LGLAQGLDGSPNYAQVIRRDGSIERYAVVTALEVNDGDVIRIRTGSGGGYGETGSSRPTGSSKSTASVYLQRSLPHGRWHERQLARDYESAELSGLLVPIE
jgi:N-methylhydantoinase B